MRNLVSVRSNAVAKIPCERTNRAVGIIASRGIKFNRRIHANGSIGKILNSLRGAFHDNGNCRNSRFLCEAVAQE